MESQKKKEKKECVVWVGVVILFVLFMPTPDVRNQPANSSLTVEERSESRDDEHVRSGFVFIRRACRGKHKYII